MTPLRHAFPFLILLLSLTAEASSNSQASGWAPRNRRAFLGTIVKAGLAATLGTSSTRDRLPDAREDAEARKKIDPLRMRGSPAGPLTRAEAMRLYKDLYISTRNGLERLRSDTTGLLIDRLDFQNDGTEFAREVYMPTNLGLDLILLTGDRQAARPRFHDAPAEAILKALRSIEAMPKAIITDAHAKSKVPSEFFYWWVERPEPTLPAFAVRFTDVSSIDNIHLALGLWVVSKNFGPSTPQHQIASRLLSKMDFSVFFRENYPFPTGVLEARMDGSYVPKGKYDYPAETRSVVPLALMMGLIKDPKVRATLAEDYLKQMKREIITVDGKRVERVWDGGSFQVELFNHLAGEGLYSAFQRESHQAIAQYLLKVQREEQTILPRTYSAAATAPMKSPAPDPFFDINEPDYTGRLGYPLFAATKNWGEPHLTPVENNASLMKALAPYALALHASEAPEAYAPAFLTLQSLQTVSGPAWRKEWGFVDAVRTDDGRLRAVPATLALDQAMTALAFSRILSEDGMTASARTIWHDRAARTFMQDYHRMLDASVDR